MAITEEILTAPAGKGEVRPGQLVDCSLDMVMKYVAKQTGLKT